MEYCIVFLEIMNECFTLRSGHLHTYMLVMTNPGPGQLTHHGATMQQSIAAMIGTMLANPRINCHSPHTVATGFTRSVIPLLSWKLIIIIMYYAWVSIKHEPDRTTADHGLAMPCSGACGPTIFADKRWSKSFTCLEARFAHQHRYKTYVAVTGRKRTLAHFN